MHSDVSDTVLIVCDDEEYSAALTSTLFDSGANVVGPVTRANMALTLAAQTSPTVAIVARPPTGVRGASELAHELMNTWGVRSIILPEAYPEGALPLAGEQPWDPRPGERARLQAALDKVRGKALQN